MSNAAPLSISILAMALWPLSMAQCFGHWLVLLNLLRTPFFFIGRGRLHTHQRSLQVAIHHIKVRLALDQEGHNLILSLLRCPGWWAGWVGGWLGWRWWGGDNYQWKQVKPNRSVSLRSWRVFPLTTLLNFFRSPTRANCHRFIQQIKITKLSARNSFLQTKKGKRNCGGYPQGLCSLFLPCLGW